MLPTRPALTALALVASLAACQSTPSSATATGPAHAATPVCQEQGLAWAVGQPNDVPTLSRLKQQSGAGIVNPIGPGTIVSKDHRADRLRVFVDADNRITAVRCG